MKQIKIIIPVSGGKDSTLTLLNALDIYGVKNCIPIFNDTGWEHPVTYIYLQSLEKTLKIKIQKTQGGLLHGKLISNLEDLIIETGNFPIGQTRFCSGHLKRQPLINWLKKNCKNEFNYEVWFGIRKTESVNRKRKYGKFDSKTIYDYDDIYPGKLSKKYRDFIKIKFPILNFTDSQVFEELRKRKIEINPLYFEGTNDRVGCYPCLLANKNAQAKMFNTDFGKMQLEKIRKLEKIIGKKYEKIDGDDSPCGFCLI